MLSHLLVISLGSPTDDSDFAARHLIHRFHYVGVDQHVAILLTDRSFIAFSVEPRLFQALSPICLYCRLVAWVARQERDAGQPRVTVDEGGRPCGQIDEQPGCGSSTARTASATWAGDRSTNTSTPRSTSSGSGLPAPASGRGEHPARVL
jgi:hypothetical protein